jgi:putative ABC transport system permease protein
VYIIPLPFVIGLLSGLYPAYFIASFQPIQSLKGQSITTSKSALRIALVTIQFAITAFLLNGTSVITRQLDFINSKDLGFDRDQILVMQTGSRTMGERLELMRQELLGNPNVLNVSAALTVPGEHMYTMGYSPYEEMSDDEMAITLPGMYVDPDFIQNMGIEVIDGRSFSKEIATDTLSFLINEDAQKSLVAKYGPEWNDPIGKKLNYFRANNDGWYIAKRGTIIGVVKDFNYASLHDPIRPLVIQVDYRLFFKILVKTKPDNLPETIAFLKQHWSQFNPEQPFNFYFLDEQFGRAYEREQKFELIFKIFAALSILISCLGLYGLVLFTTSKRTREIGIRKVLGADTANISFLLAKSFIKPIVIAFLLVLPLSIIAMDKWLEQFAYHQNPDIALFVISGAWCLLIAMVTIASRTISVSRTNPLKYLKEN